MDDEKESVGVRWKNKKGRKSSRTIEKIKLGFSGCNGAENLNTDNHL